MAEYSVADLAERVGGTLEGDGARRITGVGSLAHAQSNELSFLHNDKYTKLVAETHAAAVLVRDDWVGASDAAIVRVPDPDKAFAELTMLFAPAPIEYADGVHPTAVLEAEVDLGEGVSIGPNCFVGPWAKIGAGTVLEANVFVGAGAVLGHDCTLYASAVIREHCVVGDRCILHNHCVVGSDGFGYNVDEQGARTKVPQVGNVVLGNDVEIGASTCIDRARFGSTRLGTGVKVDNLVQIAHNVIIEDHVVLVAQVGISGSTTVKHHAVLAGQVGVAGHLTIGEHTVVGAQGGVTKDLPGKKYFWGTPAEPMDSRAKSIAAVRRLPKLQTKVKDLERELAELRKLIADQNA